MIKSHIIENEFLRIKTINFGATLFEVFYKPKKTNLILNLDKIQSYKKNKNYLGSICGRFANRIENAKFKIHNKNYNLVKNIVTELKIPFIDVSKEVFEKEQNPLKLFPFEQHVHYNVEGYKKVAEIIYKFTKD